MVILANLALIVSASAPMEASFLCLGWRIPFTVMFVLVGLALTYLRTRGDSGIWL